MQNIIVLLLAGSSLALATSQNDDSEPRFSIGLGVLAPSYTQKLAGNGRLDVNQDKSGFSYTLNNVVHPSSTSSAQHDYKPQSSPQQHQSASAHDTGNHYSPQPQLQPAQFSIYHHRQAPQYQSQSDQEYREPEQQYQQPQTQHQYQLQPQQPQQYSQQQYYSQQQQYSRDHDSQPQQQSYHEPQHQPQQHQQLYSSEPDNNYEPNQPNYEPNQPNSEHNSAPASFGHYDIQQQIQHQHQHQPLHQHQYQPQTQQSSYQPQIQQSSYQPSFGYSPKAYHKA